MSTYYMKNKEEAVNYCKGLVNGIVIDKSFKDDGLFTVAMYDKNLRGRNEGFCHLDTVYMSKRTLKAYIRDFLGLNAEELDIMISLDSRDQLVSRHTDIVQGLFKLLH